MEEEPASESKFIRALQSQEMCDRLKVDSNMTISHKRTSADSCADYDILAIDGGGVRGIMPAVWLAELERRTKRSATSLFHMMGGVLSGAIVAAGLCIPDRENISEP